jgi:proteasome accessory factor A
VTKLQILEGYRSRDGLDWDSHTLQLVDLQFHDVRPDKGLYNRLVARGSMQRLITDAEVTRAIGSPPSDTRAFFRGECLRRYPSQVAAASWDSVVFDLGRENLVRIPTMEPLRGTREHVGALFEASATAQELVDTITGG